MTSTRIVAMVCALLLQACTPPSVPPSAPASPVPATPPASGIVAGMIDRIGGREALAAVQTLVQQGSGWRMHLGQVPATGSMEPRGELRELTETLDLAGGRAASTNIIEIGTGFTQRRTEVLTSFEGQKLGWATTEGRPNVAVSGDGLFSWGTHNTPEFLLRRNVVAIALAAATLPAGAPVAARVFDGVPAWYVESRLGDENIGLYIDQTDARLLAWSALDTETLWGDTNSVYVPGDWRPVDALLLPHTLEIRKDDGVYASLRYDRITLNDTAALAVFDIPEDAREQAAAVVAAAGEPWVPLQLNPVAEGVVHALAFSHHSMVVEFPSFVVVVEAPQTEAQSLTLARMIEESSGKPIRYVVPTHPHHDHTGGVRALVALGANVLVAAGHEAELRTIVEAPHSNPPDVLARNLAEGAEVGRVEVFSGMDVISEGEQSLQLYEVTGIPHVSPVVLAFVPGSGILFQSDLFFGGPGPDASALAAAVATLALDVQQIVGGHGGVLPYAMLQAAVAAPPAPAAVP